MNLVKWLRKNNQKVMAVVVILVMLGFIGGAYVQYIGRRRQTQYKTEGYYANNQKITNYDLYQARRELEILKMLKADVMLRSIGEPLFPRTQDFRPLLLAELLFSERRMAPALIEYIKQTRTAMGLRISDKQIDDIYRQPEARYLHWLLLNKEAQLVAIRIQNKDLKEQLTRAIPNLFNNATYSQVIGELIRQQRISEQEMLTTFGKLLAVLEYARMICSNEATTSRQIMHITSRDTETMDVELVRFDSAVFADAQGELRRTPDGATEQPPLLLSQESVGAQFDKYKGFFAGTVTEQNPYGFGYKLPDRVSLEYIAVKIDDIKQKQSPPAQEESEEYYQKNIGRFTEQTPTEPNDPNSPLTTRTKSYAEVAGDILQMLSQNKVDLEAERIIQEAKTLTEANFENTNMELNSLSAEQFKQMAGDYKAVADQLSSKNNIKVYTGQTGLLSAKDIQTDDYLGALYIQPFGYSAAELVRIVFAADPLDDSLLGPFDVPKPRMYGNIGPVRDMNRRIISLVRVIKAEKASEPESINQTYNNSRLKFEQTQESTGQTGPKQDKEHPDTLDIYSVKEIVTEDLKKLAAMDIAKSKAEEFIAQAAKDGWDSTIGKFNKIYGKQTAKHESEPNETEAAQGAKDVNIPFRLQSLSNVGRIPEEVIETLTMQSAGNPGTQLTVDTAKKEALLRNKLYSLIPPDSNTVDNVPFILEFKPDMSWYCIKSISVRRLTQDDYEVIKGMQAYKSDLIQSYSLAAIHFNPDNILKRMNYRPAEDAEQTTDANTPETQEEL